MERLELYAEWLENEKELLPLLEKIRPLLERRHELEAKDPKLGLLREDRTLPGETPPPKVVGADLVVARAATMFAGTREALVGDAERLVPSAEAAMKKLTRAAKNKKKHEKEKARKKAKKGSEPDSSAMELEKPKVPQSD